MGELGRRWALVKDDSVKQQELKEKVDRLNSETMSNFTETPIDPRLVELRKLVSATITKFKKEFSKRTVQETT